jgi:hypothetical protein
MLPVVSEETRQELLSLIQGSELKSWQKEMIHHLKEDNPEVNTLLLELAQQSEDPKKIVLAGYLVYKALEMALEEEEPLLLP